MTLDEFKKADLRIAKVLEAERVLGSEKLVKLKVSLGDAERQIIAGIGKVYEPATLIGKEIVIVANLEPRQFKIGKDDPSTHSTSSGKAGSGQVVLESQGMLLAAAGEDGLPVIIVPEKEIEPGAKIK